MDNSEAPSEMSALRMLDYGNVNDQPASCNETLISVKPVGTKGCKTRNVTLSRRNGTREMLCGTLPMSFPSNDITSWVAEG
jgi:hypothetical protein